MRPLNLVIDAIINIIKQNDFDKKSELLTELRKIEEKCNVENTSLNTVYWAEVSSLLLKYLGEQDTEWKEKIALIYQGREDHTKYL